MTLYLASQRVTFCAMRVVRAANDNPPALLTPSKRVEGEPLIRLDGSPARDLNLLHSPTNS
jgi:hypothetical protein